MQYVCWLIWKAVFQEIFHFKTDQKRFYILKESLPQFMTKVNANSDVVLIRCDENEVYLWGLPPKDVTEA